jgi:hypothetical protein
MIKKVIKWMARKIWARKEWEQLIRESQWPPEVIERIKVRQRVPVNFKKTSEVIPRVVLFEKIKNENKTAVIKDILPCPDRHIEELSRLIGRDDLVFILDGTGKRVGVLR